MASSNHSPDAAMPQPTTSGRGSQPDVQQDVQHDPIAGRVGVPEPHGPFTAPDVARFEAFDDQFASDLSGHPAHRHRSPPTSGAEATPNHSTNVPAADRPPDHALDSESPLPEALDGDSDDAFYAGADEAEDYQEPTVAEMCRERGSEYLIQVLQERSNRATTLERGTAALATLRDEVCHLAQQLLQPSDGHVEMPVLLGLVKHANGLQKQIGQDYRLLTQLEKSGM